MQLIFSLFSFSLIIFFSPLTWARWNSIHDFVWHWSFLCQRLPDTRYANVIRYWY